MSLLQRWRAINPAWRYAVIIYVIGRIAFTAWSFVVLALNPLTLYNGDHSGIPVLAAFDPTSSERYVYSRQLDGTTLTFRARDRGNVEDTQTGSVWSLRSGNAVDGALAGKNLESLPELRETFFPYLDVAPDSNLLLALWQRFDTNWYLAIAQYGYTAQRSDVHFPPFYPMLIRIAGDLLGGRYLLVAGLISNLALIGALALLYQQAKQLFDAEVALRTIIYLVLSPAAFFLFASYTESLYLFLVLLMFRALERDKWAMAGVGAALAILTRLQGIALLVPLAWVWSQTIPRSILRGARVVGAPLLAIGIYLGLRVLIVPASVVPDWHVGFVLPWENYWYAMQVIFSDHLQVIDVLNVLITSLFGLVLVLGWRKLPLAYSLYAAASWILLVAHRIETQPLGSMVRFVLTLFPCFMLLGVWGKHAWVNRAIIYLAFPLNLYLSAQFVLWGWVG